VLPYIHVIILQIPIIWEIFVDDANDDHGNDTKVYNDNYAQYQKDFAAWETRQATAPSKKISQGRGKKKKQTDPKPLPPKRPKCRMHKDEPHMFLQLATSLKLFMGTSMDERTIERALELLLAYLASFKRVCDTFVSL
jgi:hypothetical protein